MGLVQNRFSTFADLRKECARLHDCHFGLDGSVFDADAHRWRATFLRPLEDPDRIVKIRKYLVLTTHSFPVLESSITIERVRAVAIHDRANIGTYTFNDVQELASGCRFAFNENLEIDLDFENPPSGEFRDERDRPDLRGYITRLAFVDFGIRVERF
jgi:hypothetical protein